jgi:hypothetical protein
MTRIATLRRDRNEIALADAGRVREAREGALAQARAAEARASERLKDADRMFAAEPASPQAQVWRRVQVERAAQARAEAETRVAFRDEAALAHDRARVELMRSDARLDRTEALHARAASAYAAVRDEREAEDRAHRPRGAA